MSERLSPPQPHLEWYDWLLSKGDLAVPCSRYGSKTSKCAWFAIAATYAHLEACGGDQEQDYETLDYFMGLAVNDHPDIAYIVKEYESSVPAEVLAELDWEGVSDEQAI